MSARLLDENCLACGRVLGEHTMREWEACAPALDMPFEALPTDDAVTNAANADLARQLGFADGVLVADHVVAKAATIDHGAIKTPLIIHEFAIGRPVFAPLPVATVVFLAAPGGAMAKYGRLIDEAAQQATRAAAGR